MHRATGAALLSAALLLLAVGQGACKREPVADRVSNVERARAAIPSAAPGTLLDPLDPGRPMTIDAEPRLDAGNWVTARPGFQASRTRGQRGGIEPCATQTVDTTGFEDWAPVSRG